jgi:Fe-S-cluster formation regulator IscX/YfhJ
MKIDAKTFEEQYKALCAKMLIVYVKQFEDNAKAEPEKILEAQKLAINGT